MKTYFYIKKTRPEDNELWNNDPLDYIRKEEDFTIKAKTNKNVAIDFLELICDLKDPSGFDFFF